MGSLINRIKKLEQTIITKTQFREVEKGWLWQPSQEELSDAVGILLKCGVVKEVREIFNS